MNDKPNTKSQVDKFHEAARELETDEREDRFDALVRQIAKSPPQSSKEGAKRDSDKE